MTGAVAGLAVAWWFTYAWHVARWARGLGAPDTPLAASVEGLTVVVPCRNEAERLGALLSDLAPMMDQILVVDDHSTDGTAAVATAHGARVLRADGHGKKAALRTGFQAATTPWVATLDGDVRVGPHWARALLGAATPGVQAVIGPVRLAPALTALDRVQSFEYGAMMAWALTTAASGRAENASSANLLWHRTTWLALDLTTTEPSGDDLFALESLLRRGGTTAAARGPAATATTPPAPGLRAWATQRARWGRKARRYATRGPQRVSLLMASGLLLLLATPLLHPPTGALLWAAKFLLDAAFAHRVTRTFALPWRPLADALLFAVAYPLMMVLALLRMAGGMTWKDRRI